MIVGPGTNEANVRFWITPGGALLVAYTVAGAELQTSVPMTTGTFVTVETSQFRLQDQVTGRHVGAPDWLPCLCPVRVPSEGGRPRVHLPDQHPAPRQVQCAGLQSQVTIVTPYTPTHYVEVMLSAAAPWPPMDGVVRDLVYKPNPEFTAFYIGTVVLWLKVE